MKETHNTTMEDSPNGSEGRTGAGGEVGEVGEFGAPAPTGFAPPPCDLSRTGTQVIGHACHEIRSPLAAAFGFAKMLQDPNAGGDQRPMWFEHVVSGMERMDALLATLARIGTVTSGKVTPVIAPADIEHVMHSGFDPMVDRGRIEVGSGPSVQVLVDEKLAGEALRNLLEAVAYDSDALLCANWITESEADAEGADETPASGVGDDTGGGGAGGGGGGGVNGREVRGESNARTEDSAPNGVMVDGKWATHVVIQIAPDESLPEFEIDIESAPINATLARVLLQIMGCELARRDDLIVARLPIAVI